MMNRSNHYVSEKPLTSISSASLSTATTPPSEAEKQFWKQDCMPSNLPYHVNHDNTDRLEFDRYYRQNQTSCNTEGDMQKKIPASPTPSHPTTPHSSFKNQPNGELPSCGGNFNQFVMVPRDQERHETTSYAHHNEDDKLSKYQTPRSMFHREIDNDDNDDDYEVNEGSDMYISEEGERGPVYQRRHRQIIPFHVEQRQLSGVSSLGDSMHSESDLYLSNGNLFKPSLSRTPQQQYREHHRHHQEQQHHHYPQPIQQQQQQHQYQTSMSGRQTGRSAALASSRPTKAKSADPAINVGRTPEPTERQQVLVEIAPGVSVPLRGARETMRAIQTDGITATTCVCCTARVRCIADAMYVICPTCRVVNHVPLGKWGVGLGF